MPPVRVYFDSGALISLFRSPKDEAPGRDWQSLAGGTIVPLSSVAVRLETIPQAAFNLRTAEVEFYDLFFGNSVFLGELDRALLRDSEKLATRYGLHGMDAIHVAAAIRLGADEFRTSEGPRRRIHAVQELRVVRSS